MSIIAMGSGGGLNNTKLRLADAAVDDVLRGRKFYSGDKTLKTGTLELTGTASANDVLYGETFYNTDAKTKVTGTLFLTGTASANDVLYGETFYNTNAKTKITGTLELTGTAYANDVLYGETFYNTNAKTKVTGTLALTGTAYASDVLYGETFYNTNAKTKVTGTMPNRGAVDTTINPGSSYTVPAGYHNGSGKVTARHDSVGTITLNFPYATSGGSRTVSVDTGHKILGMVTGQIVSLTRTVWTEEAGSQTSTVLTVDVSYSGSVITGTAYTGVITQGRSVSVTVSYMY